MRVFFSDSSRLTVLPTSWRVAGRWFFEPAGRLVTQDIRINPDPEVSFQATFGGDYRIVISNVTNSPAEGIMVLMLKAG